MCVISGYQVLFSIVYTISGYQVSPSIVYFTSGYQVLYFRYPQPKFFACGERETLHVGTDTDLQRGITATLLMHCSLIQDPSLITRSRHLIPTPPQKYYGPIFIGTRDNAIDLTKAKPAILHMAS